MIIFDESHRSIYKKYLNLIRYFDALKVGLTATPVDFIHRNTYEIFGCEDENPTYAYELDTAITEGYLVPYQVKTFTTEFLREGIKYTQLNRQQRLQLGRTSRRRRIGRFRISGSQQKRFQQVHRSSDPAKPDGQRDPRRNGFTGW